MSYVLDHITYQYSNEDPIVLKDISLEIKPESVTAIVGPSGSGKTTLAQIISGVIPALVTGGIMKGELNFGTDTMISVVSQTPEDQLFGYGVEDAVAFGLENMGLSTEEINQRMDHVFQLLNLQNLRKRAVATLSGGQRQAVCIASILVMNPDILILDEPVSSLDPNGKKLIRDVINQLRTEKKTIILIDNNLSWSADIVDRVVGLKDGEIAFQGSYQKFFDDFDLQHQLGVTVPQEVEIYRSMMKAGMEVEPFYSLSGAIIAIDKLMGKVPQRENKAENISEEEDRPAAVEVCNLTKQFRDGFTALDDITVSFPKGKVTAILGQNGSGKTTLVKHLNGLNKPTKGDVRYEGKSILNLSVAQTSRKIIMVFQHPEHMLFEQTVKDELLFCAKQQKLEVTEEKISEVLEKYGLEQDEETFPFNLPLGRKHLVTILSVLFSSADVVILDEPTLGMDDFLRQQLAEIIKELKAMNKTVIVISHEIPFIFQMMDYGVVLNNSKLVFAGNRERLSEQENLLKKINIPLPPAIILSQYCGLKKTCYNPEEFADVR